MWLFAYRMIAYVKIGEKSYRFMKTNTSIKIAVEAFDWSHNFMYFFSPISASWFSMASETGGLYDGKTRNKLKTAAMIAGLLFCS